VQFQQGHALVTGFFGTPFFLFFRDPQDFPGLRKIWIRAVIPNTKQKQLSPSCISFHSEAFPRKQKQKQGCTSHNWKCDHLWHLWPKCDQIYFAKKNLNKTEKQIRSQIQICHSLWPAQMSQIGHTFGVTGTNLFMFISFFLSWVSKTQPNHWTKWMASIRLAN